MKHLYLISILYLFALSSCTHKAEPETYLIPEGFMGKVNIIFNRKEGSPVKYDDGRRVYEIPADGILLTQFATNDGFINRKYFYKSQSGELRQLKNLEKDTVNLSKDEVGVFLDGISGVYGNSGESSSLKYQEFLISSYNLRDSFFTEDYKKLFYQKIAKISGLKQ
jgi:hypothetical protein